jgi:hypothetical protein
MRRIESILARTLPLVKRVSQILYHLNRVNGPQEDIFARSNRPLPDPELHSDPLLRWSWSMIRFIRRGGFEVSTPFRQIVVSTVFRSTNTYEAILRLVEEELDAQAAMLARPLFEDLLVAHWLVLNRDDCDWLVERFFRHRDAMALYKAQLEATTDWSVGPDLPSDPSARAKQNQLVKEFGAEARRNWWDPGSEGRGRGRDVGLRGIAEELENAAAEERMFHPRFAGGDEALLQRFERTALKWFTQFVHHTAAGLPFQPMPDGETEETPDGVHQTLFISGWAYAQQAYLLHDLYAIDTFEFEHLFVAWWTDGVGVEFDSLKWPRGRAEYFDDEPAADQA